MKMNRLFHNIAGTLTGAALLLSGVFAGSCSKDCTTDTDGLYIRIDKVSVSASSLVSNATTYGFEFEPVTTNGVTGGDNYAHTVELVVYEIRSNTTWRPVIDGEGAEWLSVYPAEGGEGDGFMRFGARVNDATEARATTVYIVYPDGSYSDLTITAMQKAREPYINVTLDGTALDPAKEPKIEAEGFAYTHKLSVGSNIDYFYGVTGGDWLRIEENAYGEFTLTIDELAVGGDVLRREGEVKFYGARQAFADVAFTLPVVQSIEPRITLGNITDNALNFAGMQPSPKTFTVNSNYDWTIEVPEGAWFSVTPNSGAAYETVTVTVSAPTNPGDPRTGEFSIVAGELIETIDVSQDSATGEAPMSGLDKPVIWGFDAAFVNTYNTNFEDLEKMTMPAHEGTGTLSYHLGDGPDTNNKFAATIGSTGQPYITGAWPGDYWLFEVPVKNFRAGTKVRFTSLSRVSATGHTYWKFEYRDGNTWKPVSEVKTASNAGNAEYTHALTADDQTIDFTVTYSEGIEDGKVEFRFTCAANWQANGSGALAARNGGTVRFSGNYLKLEGPDGYPTCPVIRVVD